MGILFGSPQRRAMTFPEPPIAPFPGANIFGQPTIVDNPTMSMQIPTVWACVSLLANSVAMMPLETFRRSSDISSRITDPPIVTNPSAGMTQSEFIHMLMVSLLLRGNAYGLIVGRDRKTEWPTQVELLNPDNVVPNVDKSGKLTYQVNNTGAYQSINPTDIWHVRGLTPPGKKIGLSPITYAAATLGLDIASRRFAAGFFDGDGIPKAVMSTDRDLGEDAAKATKKKLLDVFRNREPLVIGGGWKYTAMQVSPEESQFLATQQANVSQIARYFSIPPEMVGGSSGNSLTYSTVEQNALNFLTYGVSFWLKRIEDSYFDLLPGPQLVRFNTDALIRTDAETKAKVDVMLIAGKIKAPSEIRADRNLPPMTAAQKTEVDMAGLTVSPTGMVKDAPPGSAGAEEEPSA